jgi:hypothetical protein
LTKPVSFEGGDSPMVALFKVAIDLIRIG